MQKQKKIKNEHKKSIFCVFLALVFCIISFPFIFNYSQAGATDVYSAVIEDLEKDETFNIDDYPIKEKKYSLEVITIAESENQELFVYVYQPSGTLQATSINISQGINDNLKYSNYSLTLLSQNGTLSKYLVNDLEVKSDALRYYDISSIFRAWNEDLGDEKPDGDNTISEVSYEVAKLYTVATVDGVVFYNCIETEVVEIVDKHVGFIRYYGGWLPFGIGWDVDSHYVAFSTNYDIDYLVDAEISYLSRTGTSSQLSVPSTFPGYIDPDLHTVFLTDMDEKTLTGGGLGAQTGTWKRIESVSDFIANEDLTDETKEELNGMQWVLRFAEYKYSSDPMFYNTEVEDVTILKLTFEVNGEVYSLGVVDNKQSGGLLPDNNMPDWLNTLIEWLIRIVLTLIAVVLFVLLFPYIIKILWFILKYICLGIYWLFAWPFYLFKKK